MKRKLTAVILALLMIVTALPLSALAQSNYPVVVVGGYSSSQIYLFNDEGEIERKVWGLQRDDILAVIDVLKVITAIADTASKRDIQILVDEVAPKMAQAVELMKRNPDGTPKYNTDTWPKDAKRSNSAYILANKDSDPYLEASVRERRYSPYLNEKVGAENVYNFSVDWRQENILCARDLGVYILDVLKETGARKVNILCESHGGETTACFLSLCAICEKGGEDKEKLGELLGMTEEEMDKIFELLHVNNVVMHSPAIGVQLAYEMLMGTAEADLATILDFYEYANNPLYSVVGGQQYNSETDFSWIMYFLTLTKLNELAKGIITSDDVQDAVLPIGSMWDFVPLGYYDTMKAEKMDTPEKREAYAPIIARSDYMHYVVMANMAENLEYARKKVRNINIVAGADFPTATGGKTNSDTLVALNDSTGARLAGYGKRFADGYATDFSDPKVHCKDPSHCHVSPSMNADLAYGYLPENTFVISGQYHAMYVTDTYCKDLMEYLLLADEPVNIYSDERYPQFDITHNAKLGVYARFEDRPYGVIDRDSKALTVENLSFKSNVELVSVKVEGASFGFENVSGTTIPVGGSVSLPLKGEIPDADMKEVRITVYYLADSALFSMNSRTMSFTVRGGSPIAFDPANPTVDAKEKASYMTAENFRDSIKQFGLPTALKGFILSVVNVFRTLIKAVSGIAGKAAP